MKSLLVENWPWQDFVLGQVVCRSDSELHTVTRIPEQDIIAYLLAYEYNTILDTRGPYNKIFERRGTSGFSIDVKPTLRTWLISGVIVVRW